MGPYFRDTVSPYRGILRVLVAVGKKLRREAVRETHCDADTKSSGH